MKKITKSELMTFMSVNLLSICLGILIANYKIGVDNYELSKEYSINTTVRIPVDIEYKNDKKEIIRLHAYLNTDNYKEYMNTIDCNYPIFIYKNREDINIYDTVVANNITYFKPIYGKEN